LVLSPVLPLSVPVEVRLPLAVTLNALVPPTSRLSRLEEAFDIVLVTDSVIPLKVVAALFQVVCTCSAGVATVPLSAPCTTDSGVAVDPG
jgi:hypothetical protein